MNKPSPNSSISSSSSLAEIEKRIRDAEGEAKGASETSLSKYREIGDALIEAKNQIAKTKGRKFGEWVRETFCYTRGWSAQLMCLAKHWHRLADARSADPNASSSKPYSVDSAVRALKAYDRAKGGKKPSTMRPSEVKKDLLAKLQAAEAKIAHLERRIKELEDDGQASGASVWPSPAAPECHVDMTNAVC